MQRSAFPPFAVALLLAAAGPVAADDFELALEAYERGDYTAAAKLWTPLAESGDLGAQINLGVLHEHGLGVERDAALAERWYRAAAERQCDVACYHLGILLVGDADPGNDAEGLDWLGAAASAGHAEAAGKLRELGGEPVALGEDAPVSVGTAWLIAGGYAVTNHHVVAGSDRAVLVDAEGREHEAAVLLRDARHDVALLSVEDAERLPPSLPLAPTDSRLGAPVFTIGYPRIDVMGRSPKLSPGVVSGTKGVRDDPDSYQITVPIQPGNSGGPLINMRGEVVGLVTSMLGVGDPRGIDEPQPLPNVSYALRIGVVRDLLALAPPVDPRARVLPAGDGDLEDLADRVRDSILIVMAR